LNFIQNNFLLVVLLALVLIALRISQKRKESPEEEAEVPADLIPRSPEDPPKNFVPVFTAQNNIEAELIKSFLDNHQIESFIRGNTHRSMLGLIGAYIELEVLVPETKALEAKDLIKDSLKGSFVKESEEALPFDEEEPKPTAIRPVGPLFSLFLPLLLPGISNANSGNRKLGMLFGILSALLFVAALFALQAASDSQLLLFIALSFASMGILDALTAWLYRQKPTKQYSKVLLWAVLIVLFLWIPTLWLILQDV